MTEDQIERVARAICQERCAFYGEPPCWRGHEEWWATGEDCSAFGRIDTELASDVGCRAMAKAAILAMGDATP